jgi:hypothetical protein
MESAFPSHNLQKDPLCNIHQNGWCITQDTQPERRVLPLESHSYNKSYPSPKAYCFLEVGTDGVLLEVRNQKEGCYPWSLVATTSHILALKLTASRKLMIRSLSPLFESSLDFPKQLLHIVHSHPSVLLDSYLPWSHIVVGLQVPPYSHFTLSVLLY